MIEQYISDILKDIFKPQIITINTLRKSYITEFYKDNTKSLREKKELALLMRSSLQQQTLTYQKINIEEPTEQERNERFNRKDYMKIYREQKKEQIKQQKKEYRERMKKLNVSP